MQKFGVAVALVAVVVGLVAVNSVSGHHGPKRGPEEASYEQETGELERPRHPPLKYRVGGESPDEAAHRRAEHLKGPKGPVRGRREHHYYVGGVRGRKQEPRPLPGRRHPPKKPHYTPKQRVCSCYETSRGGPEGDRGGYEGGRGEYEYSREGGSEGGRGGQGQEGENEYGNRGDESGQGGESGGEAGGSESGRGNEGGRGGQESEGGDESSRGGESPGRGSGAVGGGQESGGDLGKRHGSFKGAGVFGGFKKEKEFDAGVRGGVKQNSRNSFQKSKTVVAGEQRVVNGGSSNNDFNTVEGVHKRKNVNNDRLVVKETQRGNEDTEAFRGQNGHSDENHFGASDTKVFGAQAGESGAFEQDNEKDFEADVHKKNSVGAVGGAGVFGGRF